MSGEFGYVFTQGNFTDTLLREMATIFIKGDDGVGVTYRLTPRFGALLELMSELAHDVAWAEAGDYSETQSCEEILEKLPAFKAALEVLEVYCKGRAMPSGEPPTHYYMDDLGNRVYRVPDGVDESLFYKPHGIAIPSSPLPVLLPSLEQFQALEKRVAELEAIIAALPEVLASGTPRRSDG